VDPVPDPLLLRKSGSAENRTRASASVARNSDQQTTEAVAQLVKRFTFCPVVLDAKSEEPRLNRLSQKELIL
jgi:hypothetical protein